MKSIGIINIELLRKQFVIDFDRTTLENLTLEQYTGDKNSFCYRLKYEQTGMGDISVLFQNAFGVYKNKEVDEYIFIKKYGDTLDKAFKRIRSELCKLIDAGKKGDYRAIRESLFPPLVRSKIVSMYYPDEYLTIHSERHLIYFCSKAKIPYLDEDDELILQNKLISWKESHSGMQDLSLLEYVEYLYKHFGHPPKDERSTHQKSDSQSRQKRRLKDLKKKLILFDGLHPKKKLTEVEITQRSSLVTSIAKERAAGVCQLCNKPAPFYNKKGEPYLECHHIVWLKRDGADEPDNVVALCPNCHKKMHILDEYKDVEYLKKIAKEKKSK